MEIDDDFDIMDLFGGTVVFAEMVSPLLVAHIFNNAMRVSWMIGELCKEEDQRNAVIQRLTKGVKGTFVHDITESKERPTGEAVWRVIINATAENWEEDTARIDMNDEFYGLLADLENKKRGYENYGTDEGMMSMLLSCPDVTTFLVKEIAGKSVEVTGEGGHAKSLKGLELCPKCGEFHRKGDKHV